MLIKISGIRIDSFKCQGIVKRYLVEKCHIPILSLDEKFYYFAWSTETKEAIINAPMYIKFLIATDGYNNGLEGLKNCLLQ